MIVRGLRELTADVVPIVWDYAESSIFSRAAGDLVTSRGSMYRVLDQLGTGITGRTGHADARTQSTLSFPCLRICEDLLRV
jgi:hypothetical protein